MHAYEIAPDFWGWTGRHDGIGADVSSFYYRAGQDVLLFDPLLPPEDPDGFWTALDRDVLPIEAQVHVLITAPSHTRSTAAVVERYAGTRVWVADSGTDGVEERGSVVTDPFAPGDSLPAGVQFFETGKANEVMYWVPEHHALIVGNTLYAGDEGLALCPVPWLPAGTTQEQLRAALGPVLELGVERVLVSHGAPVLEGGGETLRSLAAN